MPQLRKLLPDAVLLASEARGKQLLFRFSKGLWLGVHLGMTGRLLVATSEFRPGKHDHLVLYQDSRALIFNDPRQFGRIQFHAGEKLPVWWANLPPSVNAPEFRRAAMHTFLGRHSRLSIKATLLLQAGFPGVGNWMADEILWRARIHPLTRTSDLTEAEEGRLWAALRFVARGALKHVGRDFSDPPASWLFHERWQPNGRCPIHRSILRRETVGGRTTAWCQACQGRSAGPSRREPVVRNVRR